jgi:hypothetical protein
VQEAGASRLATQMIQWAAINRYWHYKAQSRVPIRIRAAIKTIMTIRMIEHKPGSILASIPVEMMFEIFSYLPICEDEAQDQQQQQQQQQQQ